MSESLRQPRIIGLTGTIAAGKSTVAAILRARGAQIIDGDEVYRELLRPRSSLWQNVVDRFGPSILGSDDEIDRGALGAVVFSDSAALAELDAMTHPAVVAEIRRRVHDSGAPIVVIEAVKLARTVLVDDLDALWLVDAPAEVRQERLMARSGLDASGAKARIDAFRDPVPEGVQIDISIDNSGDRASTERQVAWAWNAFLANYEDCGRMPQSVEDQEGL